MAEEAEEKIEVPAQWLRELIDAALECAGGSINEVFARYPGNSPSETRRRERDLEPIRRIHDLCGKAPRLWDQ